MSDTMELLVNTKKAVRRAVFSAVLVTMCVMTMVFGGLIQFYAMPRVEANYTAYETALAEKDALIQHLTAVYKSREEDFEARQNETEYEITLLNAKYEYVMELIEKYENKNK